MSSGLLLWSRATRTGIHSPCVSAHCRAGDGGVVGVGSVAPADSSLIDDWYAITYSLGLYTPCSGAITPRLRSI